MDLETKRSVRLTNHIASDGQPSWSPDGARVLFVSDRDRDSYSGRAHYQIYVMARDGSDIRRVRESASADFMPRWSPDGRWIAFLSDGGDAIGLYVMPSAGGDARSLLPQEFDGDAGNPTWSPESDRVAFDAPTGDGYDIYSVDLGGSDVVNHTRSVETEWYPVWSPDGTEILFGLLTDSAPNGAHQLVAINLATGAHRPVTSPTPLDRTPRDWWPDWSPDGSRVVFSARREGLWRLFVGPADGTGGRPLADR